MSDVSKGKAARTPSRTKQDTPTDAAVMRATTLANLAELARLAALYPALTPLDHDTLVARFDDAYCEALGTATKSRGTLKDALAWLRVLHPPAGARPLGDTGVSAITLALLVEWTRRLLVEVESMAEGLPAGLAEEASMREAAKARYRSVRDAVEEALGHNAKWIAILKSHLDGSKHDELDADVARLLRLADAVKELIALHATTRHALADEGVTDATPRGCTDDALALEKAIKAKPRAGNIDRDTPAVNLVEGRVLVLMTRVFRAVNKARAAKRTTLVLQPGAATKRVVQPPSPRKKAPVDEGANPAAEPAKKRSTRGRTR